jgi:hypothetical protein
LAAPPISNSKYELPLNVILPALFKKEGEKPFQADTNIATPLTLKATGPMPSGENDCGGGI